MDESRNVLRYVIPGVIYLLGTTVLTGILFSPSWLLGRLARLPPDGVGIGAAIVGVVASGGIGYVFSVIHHFLHNRLHWHAAVDYSELLNRLVGAGKLPIHKGKAFTRTEALPVLISLWNQRTE